METIKDEFRADKLTRTHRKLSPEIVEDVISAMLYGLTLGEACSVNNLSHDVMVKWRREHPDVDDHIENARRESYEALEARRYRIISGDLSTDDRVRDLALVRAIEWAMERRGNYQRQINVSHHHAALTIVNDPTEIALFGNRPLLQGPEDAEFTDIDESVD